MTSIRGHSHAYYVRGSALIELGCTADGIAALDGLLPTDDCNSLLNAASQVRCIGDYVSARRYLDRIAELQPDNRGLWIERTWLHIDEGAYGTAAESAARVESLPGDSLMGRLLVAQAAAGIEPLLAALDTLGPAIEPDGFKSDELLYRRVIAGMLSVSVRNFGPQHLSQGLVKLRDLLAASLDQGVIGAILTGFLIESVNDGLAGSLAEWEKALEDIASSMADLSDCRIPIEMLRAAVRYSWTDDERHLLSPSARKAAVARRDFCCRPRVSLPA